MSDRTGSSQASQPAATCASAVEQDLASLRRRWGDVYRITWDRRFRATHIASGDVIEASTARELCERIRAHHCERVST